MDLTEIHRAFDPNTEEQGFFSEDNRTFSKINHMLGYKANLNKHKKIEITSCLLSNHRGIKLDTDSNRNSTQYTNSRKLSNTVLMITESKWNSRKKFTSS